MGFRFSNPQNGWLHLGPMTSDGPLARAQARALRALGADTPPPAASPETSVSVMASPSTSTGAGDDSPSRPSLDGAAEVSAPSSPLAASTADASGAGSESSSTRPGGALGSRLEAAGSLSDVDDALAPVPRSPAPWEYELPELRDDIPSLEARLAASEASLRREVDLRLKAERSYNQASHERNAALENLRRIRLDHADAARQLVATNIALEQSSQAAAALGQRCRRLDKSLADTHKVIRHDREQFKAGISSYAAQPRQLREYLEQSDQQSSASGGASSASASAMPAAFATFLEELGALHLVIPPPAAASGSSEGSGPTTLASSGSLGGAAATSGSSTSLTVDSDTSDDSVPVIPSSHHKGKGKRAAKSFDKLRSAPPLPKKKQRLGRPSVDLKARKASKRATSAAVSSSGPSQSVPSSLPAVPVPTSSAPISLIAVSVDSDVLSFASIPSGSDPPFSPIPWTPASPASSTASAASLSSTPVVSRGIAPGTEASVPVEIDDDGGSGADGAASEASVAPGGVLSSPVVSQPWRDGRPTRAASTTAGLRSMAAAENEAAPDALRSIADIQAFADWEDPLHPWQRLRARLPESPCTFGADDFMPDKPIWIRASGLAIVVKMWRQFTGRAVGRTEHSDLGFALWERAHWISVAAVEQWLQQLYDRIGLDTPEYLETEVAWRAYNKARNLRADRLRLQIPNRFWVWCIPDASGKIKCPPEILLEPSMLQYSFETLTWAPSTAAWTTEVVDLDARQPWRNC
ncbi:unnamed protein product [Phytophthora fragariaefolia]|uniref:Unnamed protein product n=1 Tax=Phytophthora fragariaefolia TaxID=1490495 RepID=A0A9W6XZE8_9STRA|nr:unnamed protein product [Phytophthora fragariaefolia]